MMTDCYQSDECLCVCNQGGGAFGSDLDGWCHGDYVPVRFQMSHWKMLSGD